MTEDQLYAVVRGGVDERRLPVPRARGGPAGRRPRGAAPVPRGAADARRDHARLVEREFSFLLDGDRVRGRWTASTSSLVTPADPVPVMADDPGTGADVVEPTLDLSSERMVITDYKSSDVRDPARARQRAKDSLQLSIYAMGYEAMTGRLPDAVALHFLDSGLVGTAPVDRRRIDKAEVDPHRRRGIRARDFDGQARPPARAAGARSGRSARPARCADRAATLAADARLRDRGRRRGPGARRHGRGRQPRRAARAARRLRRPRVCGPAVRDRRVAAAVHDPDRPRRADAARVRRPDIPLRGRVRHRVVRRPAARRPPRGAPRPPRRDPPRPGARTARCTSTSTGGPRTTRGCCSTRSSAPTAS